jgi:signal transduction histidine kinase/HPt (histidine-containing phosphotransfer) domain-containing protein/FixJ family two-component response regulator
LAVIWGVIWFHLDTEYRHTVRNGVERSATFAKTLEENISWTVAVLDAGLTNSRGFYLRDKEHFKIGPWMREKPVLMKVALQMSITDATGTVVTSSGDNGPPPVNIADREHFRVQLEATEDRMFISTPVIGRVSGRLSIQFTRRIVDPDGTFAGVVVASFDPFVVREFQNGFQLDGTFAMLIGGDGTIRAAQPETALIGGRFPDSALLKEINATGNEPLLDGTKTVIGDLAIVSYRKVAGTPLFVTAGLPNSIVFALYASERRINLMAGTALSLAVLLAGIVAIRQRRRLTRFHRALILTMDNITQGILMIDKRRRMPVVNRRVAELLGLPESIARSGAEFDALVAWQLRHGEFRSDNPEDRRILAMVSAGGVDTKLGFYERTRANGTVLEVRTTVLPDGSAVRTFTDITERKRFEREMADARDAARAGERARTEFLAVMSHEIRTPMNGIIGAAGLLRDMHLTTEQLEYVRIIRECSDQLSSLIQNILDFTRLDGERLVLEEIAFDPRALIQDTVAALTGQARAKGLSLVATIGEMPVRVAGDAARLNQILENLINNGIKFTDTGGVTVDARMIAADAETVTIAVAVVDSGVGIDPDSKQRLSFAFTQADSSMSRRFGGAGLGLAICKHLVALMGGTIDVESVPGEGCTFRFRVHLRRAPAESPTEPPGAGTPKPVRRLKVLLAEDNPTNRHVATRMLTRMGHAVDAVEDGAQAISAAAEGDYDVILMDVMMPEVDGLAATRAIRAGSTPSRDIVIVGLTANALPSDRAACAAAGMNDFVTKPVTLERLRAVLEQSAAQKIAVSDRDETPDTVGFDSAFLHQLAKEIGADGVAEMIGIFVEDAPAHIAAIRRGMAAGALQSVRREAHALAGAASNVGLTRLTEASRTLQHASERAGGPDADAVEAVAAALHHAVPLAIAWAEAHAELTIEEISD